MNDQSTKNINSIRLHPPTFDLGKAFVYIALLAFIPCLFFFFITPQIFVKILGIIISAFFIFFSWLLIRFVKDNECLFTFDDQKIIVKKGKEIYEHPLNSIINFSVVTTHSLEAGGELTKKELFLTDTKGNKQRIYISDNANRIGKQWLTFCSNIEKITGKKVVSINQIQDVDGKVTNLNNIKSKRFNENGRFFKNVFK